MSDRGQVVFFRSYRRKCQCLIVSEICFCVIIIIFFTLKYQVEYQYGGLTQNLTLSLEEQLCLSLLDSQVSCSTLELLRPYFFHNSFFAFQGKGLVKLVKAAKS